jgi:iron(III) transport system permease protein
MRPPRFLPSIVISLFGIIVLLPILYMFLAPFVLQASQLVDAPRPLFEVRHLNLAKNSLGLALGTSVMSLILGVLLAFLIQRTSMPGKSVFRVIYIIPILIPPYIHAIVWGHVNPWIKQIFCADIHSLGGALFVLTLAYFPFVTLTTAFMRPLAYRQKNNPSACVAAHFRRLHICVHVRFHRFRGTRYPAGKSVSG